MNLFSSKKRQQLGIDIGSSSVKLVGIEPAGGNYRISHLAVESLPEGAVYNDSIKDTGQVAEAIRRAWYHSGAKVKDCVLAVPGSSVITRHLFFPRDMSEQEMESQIEIEAAQHVPYALDEVSIDFQVIGESVNDANQVEVLLAASRSENINILESVVEEAGLTAGIVDVETFALGNAYSALVETNTLRSQTVAVIDIGAGSMIMVVMHNKRVLYTRDLSFGMRQFEEELRRQLGDEANIDDVISGDGADTEEHENNLLEPFRQQLIQQVGRALQFFASSSQYQPVDSLVLSGGGARLPRLAPALQKDQGLTCHVADIPGDMRLSNRVSNRLAKTQGPALMMALGLALRGYE